MIRVFVAGAGIFAAGVLFGYVLTVAGQKSLFDNYPDDTPR